MKIPFDAFDAAFRKKIEASRQPITKLADRLTSTTTDPLYTMQRSEDAFHAAAEMHAAWHIHGLIKGLCDESDMFDTDHIAKELVEWAAAKAASVSGWTSGTYQLAEHVLIRAYGKAAQPWGTPARDAINEVVGAIKKAEREAADRIALWYVRKGNMWRKYGNIGYARSKINAGIWPYDERPALAPGEVYEKAVLLCENHDDAAASA